MSNRKVEQGRSVELRKQAEAIQKRRAVAIPKMSPSEIRNLVHELQTHQLELELQNDELQQAQMELIEARDKYADLYDFAPVGYLTVNEKGRIVEANLTFANMVEVERQDLAGQHLNAFIRTEHQDSYYLYCKNAFETGERGACELQMTPQGSRDTFWAKMECVVAKAADGEARFRHAVSDITDRKQVEADRDHLDEQLRQAHKMETIGQLAGGIAHSFNNLLTVILGNVQLMKSGLPSTGKHAKFADEAIQGVNRAADLTEQLLAFSRKGKWQVTPVSIHNAITQTGDMLRNSIDRRVEIQTVLSAARDTIMGDPTQLQSALLSLGINARDAMADGGTLRYATRNITLTEADCHSHQCELTPGEFLEICVSDTGTGMDEKTQTRIFEPFFTTKEVGKGTGLGLAGVHGCVRNHEGTVSVSSQPDCGTTFTILLPLAPDEATKEHKTATNDELVKGTGHILILDDEQSIRSFVQTILQKLGYTVSTCRDGVEGVEYYREHHHEIDLVILDLVMPRMSGEDAFLEMKRIDPNVKVLISSGFSRSDATQRMLDEGAVALLSKPFKIASLSQIVASHLQGDKRR